MTALEKLLKGEVLTEEEKTSLTPEQIDEAKRKGLEAVEALRKEGQRLTEKHSQEDSKFASKFMESQSKKAEEFVFNDLVSQGIELTEEKKAKIRETGKRLGPDAVSYDDFVDNFLSAAAAIERKTLFDDRKKKLDFEKNAANYNISQAGANGSGGNAGGEGTKQYPQEVWDMIKDAANQGLSLTPDEALNSLTRGMKRVYK